MDQNCVLFQTALISRAMPHTTYCGIALIVSSFIEMKSDTKQTSHRSFIYTRGSATSGSLDPPLRLPGASYVD